ncbi:MAG: trehalase family glycosidase [Victivallaceae bacterium]|jgi:glycogen debranching enzyme
MKDDNMKKIINYKYDRNVLPIPVYEERPEWIELYYAAWEIAFCNIEYPSKRGWLPQLTCMPGVGIIWQWDSCFMSFFAKYSNGSLPAMNNLNNLYRLQGKDGFQSMAYVIETGKPAYGQRINPPLFAWTEWEYYLLTGDNSRVERVFPKLSKYYNWLKNNRTRSSGLYWFEDSGSSGMDNSPRSGYPSANLNGSDVCWIDLICQQALSASCLAKIAKLLGNKSEEAFFLSEHETLCTLINKYHWSEKHGFYYDVFDRMNPLLRHNFLNTKTAAAFWPLLCGAANETQINSLTEHLLNPDEFWTRHPIPTLSRDDSNYDPLGGYWLGGVWAPTNYMTTAGLKKQNRHSIARDLAVKHLDAMSDVIKNKSYGSIWECYSPDYIRPATKNEKGKLVRNNFVGWSGLGPIAMLIENIMGFTFDAQSNIIHWRITSSCAHGIKGLQFNGRTVSLLCGKSASTGQRKINIETSKSFSVSIKIEGRDRELSETLNPGKYELYL